MPEYNEILLNRIQLGMYQRVSEEIQHLIERGDLRLIDELAIGLAYEFTTYVYGKEINEVTEYKRVRVPKTWFSHFLQDTWLGRLLANLNIEPKYVTHVLEVKVVNSITFPEWIDSFNQKEFGKVVVVSEPRIRYHHD